VVLPIHPRSTSRLLPDDRLAELLGRDFGELRGYAHVLRGQVIHLLASHLLPPANPIPTEAAVAVVDQQGFAGWRGDSHVLGLLGVRGRCKRAGIGQNIVVAAGNYATQLHFEEGSCRPVTPMDMRDCRLPLLVQVLGFFQLLSGLAATSKAGLVATSRAGRPQTERYQPRATPTRANLRRLRTTPPGSCQSPSPRASIRHR